MNAIRPERASSRATSAEAETSATSGASTAHVPTRPNFTRIRTRRHTLTLIAFWQAPLGLGFEASRSPSGNRYDVAGDSTRPLPTRDQPPALAGRGDAWRELGGLSLADALLLCELLAKAHPQRYERAALRRLERFIEERLPPLTEVALAAAALAELRHGQRNTGVDALKRLLRQG
jgi:hypothetical protein